MGHSWLYKVNTSEMKEDCGGVARCATPSPVDFAWVGSGKCRCDVFLLNIWRLLKKRQSEQLES